MIQTEVLAPAVQSQHLDMAWTNQDLTLRTSIQKPTDQEAVPIHQLPINLANRIGLIVLEVRHQTNLMPVVQHIHQDQELKHPIVQDRDILVQIDLVQVARTQINREQCAQVVQEAHILIGQVVYIPIVQVVHVLIGPIVRTQIVRELCAQIAQGVHNRIVPEVRIQIVQEVRIQIIPELCAQIVREACIQIDRKLPLPTTRARIVRGQKASNRIILVLHPIDLDQEV